MSSRRKHVERDGPRIWARRTPQGLVPASDTDREWLERHPIGATLILTLHEPKNEAQHKAYFAMLSDVAKGTGFTVDGLHWEIRLAGGFREEVVGWQDTAYVRPRSTTQMDAAEFTELFRYAELWLAERGIDVESLRKTSRSKAGLPAPLQD